MLTYTARFSILYEPKNIESELNVVGKIAIAMTDIHMKLQNTNSPMVMLFDFCLRRALLHANNAKMTINACIIVIMLSPVK